MGFLIYAIAVVDKISSALGGVMFVGAIGLVIATISWFFAKVDMEDDELAAKIMRLIKKMAVVCSIYLVAFVLIPSSSTIAAMYLIPKVAANEHIQRIPDKALTVLEQKLDEYIKSVK